MKRGDILIVRGRGDKARPAVVVQSDAFMAAVDSVTVCPRTTHLVERSRLRVEVSPTPENGLSEVSQVMVDKIQTYMTDKISPPVGRLEPSALTHIDIALRSFLGIQIEGLEEIIRVGSQE